MSHYTSSGPSSTTPAVAVVIRCYNEERHIGRLIAGILDQTVDNVEIIVVDSGSTDRTVAIAERYATRVLRIKPEEFSFGRALNLGFAAATAPVVVAASAHVYPLYRDWLEKLLAPFSDPTVALVYGKQRGNEVTKYSEHQIFHSWFGEEPCSAQQTPFCNNANAAVRRQLWQQLPYDEELTGLEDLDWAKRAQQRGFSIAYCPDAVVAHVHEETWARVMNRYRREAIALLRIFPEQHFGIRDFAVLCSSNIAADYLHAIREGVFWRNLASIPLFRIMQFWGTYRGFNTRGNVTAELKRTVYYPRSLRKQTAAAAERPRIDYQGVLAAATGDTAAV